MGAWSYSYDPLGNLIHQTDARGQTTCLYYDALDRLAGEHYRTDTSCPGSPVLDVSYSSDDTTNGNYGVGRRTGMMDYQARWGVYPERRTKFASQRDPVAGAVRPGRHAGTGSGAKWNEPCTFLCVSINRFPPFLACVDRALRSDQTMEW